MSEPNQIKPELLSVCSINSFHQHNSSSRTYMFANHLGQMLTVAGANEKLIQSGTEREFGKYTFKVEMPCDGQIIEIIDRYRPTLGKDSIKNNPETVVVYADASNGQIGMFRLSSFSCNHQYFGFEYKQKEGMLQLRVGAMIKKGTVFLDSPAIAKDNSYQFGIQANIAYMTHPAASEDGILVSRSFLPKLKFKTYESRVVEWGSDTYALNLYGDEQNYKSYPDIGEYIREDGLLMALRSNNPIELAIVEKSIRHTMNVDYTFDTTIYGNGGGGKIIDIKIHHDINNNNYAETHMDEQSQKYDESRRIYCKRIVDLYNKLYKQKGESLQLTPEFNRLVVECMSVVKEQGGPKIIKTYRQEPLDNYRIEFTIEYEITPNIGFKLTDIHGGKGVLCHICEDEEMPVDQEGNRADVIMDPNSTISRMNLGRLYEQYINASSRDTHKAICKMFNLKPFIKQSDALSVINNSDSSITEQAWNYLLGYYKIVSPRMFKPFELGLVSQPPSEFLSEIVNKGITLYIPTDNEPNTEDIIMQLEQHYKPVYGPVSYIGNSGIRTITKNPIRIGSVYMILLEKTGDDWAAVASSKLQHFGVPSPLTKIDKYSKPARYQAVRGAGEAEVRILISYIGSKFVAEMMDRNNNPQTHKHILNNILSSDKPTNIYSVVNRKEIGYGGAKPVQLANHILECSGVKFKFKPYETRY